MGWVAKCLSRLDTSHDMQQHLLRSPSDLDLRSNFEVDQSRSSYCVYALICLDEVNTMVPRLLLYISK